MRRRVAAALRWYPRLWALRLASPVLRRRAERQRVLRLRAAALAAVEAGDYRRAVENFLRLELAAGRSIPEPRR